MRRARRRVLMAGAGVVGALVLGAQAGAVVVFDPTNYAQNLLQAARALQQINNQIQALQNQAAMLTAWARQLKSLDFSSLSQIAGVMDGLGELFNQAQGIGYDVSSTDAAIVANFGGEAMAPTDPAGIVAQARALWDMAEGSFRTVVRVQSQLISGVRSDMRVLGSLVDSSQSAVGGLQAQQAANQILALLSRQQLQTQALLAAQGRAQVLEANRQAQALAAARVSTRRFLSGRAAYTPQ